MPLHRNKINRYTCDTCGMHIVTVDLDEGTTPFFLACRATLGCQGRMLSAMYAVDQSLAPTYEWYKPTTKKVPKHLRGHVKLGGLLLRLKRD